MKKFFSLISVLLLISTSVFSQESEVQTDSLSAEDIDFIIQHDSIKGIKGRVELEGANAYVVVPEGYVFLDKEAGNRLMADYWGNEQDDDMLGVLIVDTAKIYANVDNAFIVYYEDCGYVKDDDVDDIDYDDLLESIKEDISADNEGRKEMGLSTCELVGWAADPYYDKNEKTLNWAKHLQFEGEAGVLRDVLNYDIRVLGRNGFLVMTAVADLDDLASVENMKKVLLSGTHFEKGYTYADFDASTDHVAEWSVGALVAGKMMAKAGLFAKLGAILLKFKGLILVAFASIAAFFSKFFGKKKKEEDDETKNV